MGSGLDDPALMFLIRLLAIPALVVGISMIVAPLGEQVPPTFSGLWQFGPHIALGALATLALAWRRGRLLIAAMAFALLVLPHQHAGILEDRLPGDGLWPLIESLVVPINLALVALYAERGIWSRHNALRVGLFLTTLVIAAGWVAFAPAGATRLFEIQLPAVMPDLPAPAVALGSAMIAVLIMAFAAVRSRSHIDTGMLVASTGVFSANLLGMEAVVQHATLIAAGLVLAIAILQDSWNMAYRDELTGLPGRRALNELMMSLGPRCTIAMLDVDHFKKFNDTHGHDVGDDVLRMVAARIGGVRGGGRAFRYGGEEFTIVFAGKTEAEAHGYLEAVRKSVESHAMVLRPPRAGDDEAGSARRGRGPAAGQKTVSVTISIGAAERTETGLDADQLLKQADQALYDAKRRGRNRVVSRSMTRGAGRPMAERATRAA